MSTSQSHEAVRYIVDGHERTFFMIDSPAFQSGTKERLSTEEHDIIYSQPWYEQGFIEEDLLSPEDFRLLVDGLTSSIAKIIEEELSIDLTGFSLEHYHRYVRTDEQHQKVISRTRDLFFGDFNFSLKELLPLFNKKLGFELTNMIPQIQEELHIIVRINRPNSDDFNPPHKDIYEAVDVYNYVAPFLNFWMPIAGVNAHSNLPLAPGSHLLGEDQVIRTKEGGNIQGNKYSVRMVKSWGGQNELTRSTVSYGQVLIFSAHLIHGLSVNDNEDLTRVALEFRLFKK